jgi:hypothetical protein
LVILLPAAVALVFSAWLGLNFDIRYAFGGLRAAPGTVFDTFVHRPLAYRVLVWLLDLGPRVITPHARAGEGAEAIIRGETLLLVTAVCVLVWAGMRRHRAGLLPAVVAVGLWCAFTLAPNWSFLEPDWVGALWATAAVGAALFPRRAALAGPVAGVLVLLCVATKLTTAPYAVIAAGVVWLFHRKRAYLTAAWSAGFVLLWLVCTWRFERLEWQWLRDMSVLVPDSPFKAGLGGLDWAAFGESAVNLLVVSPVVLVIPAATVVLARSASRPVPLIFGIVGAVVGTAVPVVAQGEWYLYQWVALPVLAAGLGAAALATRPTPISVAAVLTPAVAGGVFSMLALTRPLDWRAAHLLPQVAVVFAVIAGIGFAVAYLKPPRVRTLRGVVPLAAVTAVVAFGAANLPAAAYSMTMAHAEDTNLSLDHTTADLRRQFGQLRQEIGQDTTVLYLAFGDVNYLLGNPTDCRYPSPVWLQRSGALPYVKDFASYHDNVTCLDTTARYLLIDRSWFDLPALEPTVVARIDDLFDCDQAIHATETIDVCPRRT